ncbi:MAG: ABC transporter permease [Gemmatimonadota bacterium]
MSFWRQLTHGVRALLNRRTADQDVADEVEHYLEQASAAHVARGLTPEAARRAARLEVGSPTAVRQEVRSSGWENVVGTAFADLRYALRVLRKAPVFTAVAIVVIAVGSGAVTTIFSAMNAIVLRPLPGTTDPGRLIGLERHRPDANDGISASYEYFDYLRRNAHSLDGLAAWSKVTFAISSGGEGIAVYGNMVSGNYFSVLGVRPALGRFFTPEEDRTPLTHPVLVVSHAFWRTRLGGDSGVVGRPVTVNGLRYTIVGVAPPAFHGAFTPILIEAWVPLMMQQHLRPGRNLEHMVWLWTFGRLKEGVSRDAANRELEALTTRYIGERTEPADRSKYTAVRVSAMTGLPTDAHTMALGFIGLLLGAAALVLLIASVNVASMLSARAIARRREMAVRAALGAGRGRIVRQLLTEILVLFAAGACGGMILAWRATAGLERFTIPTDVPMAIEISPDARVFGFALAVSLITGLGFGLAPALRAAKTDINTRLRDGTAAAGSRRRLMSSTLIVGQLALSLVLLVAAGLFLRALDRGAKADTGFDPAGVATATFNTESWGYDGEKGRAFYRALRERVGAIPGVTAVSFTSNMPLAFATSNGWIELEGRAPGADGRPVGEPIQLALVGADYFAAIRLPLVAGRAITGSDDERSSRVAVVNETLAKRFWPDGSGLGRAFRFQGQGATIVGIARDAKYGSLSEEKPAFAYFAMAQEWRADQVMLVRSAAGSEPPARAIQAAVLSIDPLLPRPVITPLREANSIVLLPQRIAALVTGVLGGVGLLLATVGLYGIIAYSVSRRTREIGLRVALGADRRDVLRLIVSEGMRLAALGVVIGLVLAAAATRLLAGLLFSVSPLDGTTFVVMSVLFVGVAALASYLPVRRAAAGDPMAALRTD